MQQDSSYLQHSSVPYAPFQGQDPNPMGNNPVMVVEQRIPYSNYNSTIIKWLCVGLILLGIGCINVQIVALEFGDIFAVIGSGIWAGFFFIVTGSIGVASIRKRKQCLIVSFLVMSIIGSVVAIGPLVTGAFGWAYAIRYPWNYTGLDTDIVALNVMLVFAAIISGVMMIISSVFVCKTLWCNNEAPSHAGMMYPNQVSPASGATGQQQIIIIPSHQSLAGASYIPVLAPGANAIQGQQVPMNYPQAGQLVYIQPSGVNMSAAMGQSAPPLASNGQQAPPPAFNGQQAPPPAFNGQRAPPPVFNGPKTAIEDEK